MLGLLDFPEEEHLTIKIQLSCKARNNMGLTNVHNHLPFFSPNDHLKMYMLTDI